MWAAARNNADAVRLLIEAGADLRVRTNNKPAGRAAQMTVFLSPQPTGFTALLFAPEFYEQTALVELDGVEGDGLVHSDRTRERNILSKTHR